MITPEDLTRERYTTGQIGELVGKHSRTINYHREAGKLKMEWDEVSSRWMADKNAVIDYIRMLGLWADSPRHPAVYARVASRGSEARADLERQIGRLCQTVSGATVYSDMGSGLNAKRKGLKELMEAVIRREIDAVYVTHKDRLTRVGYPYLEEFFGSYGTAIEETESKESANAQEELVEDIMSLLTSFSAQLSGMDISRRLEIARRAKEILSQSPGKEA